MLAATIIDQAIEVREHPDPIAGSGELLVRVHAAGLNGADLSQVAGRYPAPPGVPADIPGMELAGEVIATGGQARRFKVGDRVMGVVGGGAQAELAVMPEREAIPLPENVSWVSGGGFPEVFTTAHDALFSQCGLVLGERLCVHGAAGGVGTAAVQLGWAAGARVVATVRDQSLRAGVEALGALTIDPEETGSFGPYDVILELVGAPNMKTNLGSLATGGRISVIGIGAGAKAEINLSTLMTKRARIHGSTLRSRPPEAKATAARLVEAHVLPGLTSGKLTVPVQASYPLVRAAEAYRRFAEGGKLGKIVITMD